MGGTFRGQLEGHVQASGQAVKVANRMRAGADAKAGHDVVEKAVEMIRGEQHDQIRLEGSDPFAGRFLYRKHFVQDGLGRIVMTQQRRV